MTKSEYQELVEFLGPKFDAIDRRFDAMDERLTSVEVLAENDRRQIQILAESVGAVWSDLKAVRSEMDEGFAAVRSEMAAGFDAQGRLIRGLGGRVGRLEA